MSITLTDRRLLLRATVVVALAAAVLALGNLRLRALPPEAASWRAPLVLQATPAGEVWETAALRADVTIAGVSWSDAAPNGAWVRGSEDGEAWTPWTPLVIEAEHGPDPGTAEAAATLPASEPAYLGTVEWVQFRVDAANPAGINAEFVETSGRQRSALQQLSDLWRRVTWGSGEAEAAPDQPQIISRDVWGGDRCLGDAPEEPDYNDGVRAFFVHHTATAGSYTAATAPDVIYSICSYHVNNRGWQDIGYNYLIDQFGNIYEGRAGGIDQDVWAAHTGGFNYYSTGVGLIADHNVTAVSDATRASLIELAAWRMDVSHIDPTASVMIESLGSTKFEQGVVVDMERLSGHRDASLTACPGDLCYPLLGQFRTEILETGGAKIFGGGPDVVPPFIEEPVDFSFSITETADWHFEFLDASGRVLVEADGTGTSDVVSWDGMIDGDWAPPGDYVVRLTAVTESGETPTPVDRTVTWLRPPFRDDETSVHEASINALAEAEITEGCSEYFTWYFCPNDTVHRDQMASFLARALDLPESTTDHFVDDNGNTHEAAINAVADAGITLGCADGYFCPREHVSRWQMALFLDRALELPPSDVDHFTDDDDQTYEAAINAIADAGVTLGCAPERFCPGDSVLRGQMASFLDRAFISGS